MSAGESSWAMHIANFLASPYNSQEMCQEPVISGSSSFSSGFSSSFATSYDDASFITSEMMCDDDDDDDSLQDTACSSAAAPKVRKDSACMPVHLFISSCCSKQHYIYNLHFLHSYHLLFYS
jgi:hypothetical protein